MAIRGCLLKLGADITGANYSAAWGMIPWDTEVYDTHGFHSGSSSKIIIPASMNGLYGIFTSCYTQDDLGSGFIAAGHWKNAAIPPGGGIRTFSASNFGNGQSTSQSWNNIISCPMLLTTGDEWESGLFTSSDTSSTVKAHSTFGLYVFGNANIAMRCVARVGTQTGLNHTTPSVIAFDGTDLYDTHSIHDPSSNNTKLIIPSALNGKYGVVFAQTITLLDATGSLARSLAIRKGGSLTWTGMAGNSGRGMNHTSQFTQAQTQVVQFSTGEEYEALHWVQSDTSISLDGTYTKLGLWVYG